MKTISKKLASIVLALCLCFSLVGTALAAGTSADDTGTITISGLESGVTVTAYQIAKASYDSEGNFLGYEMLYETTDGLQIDKYGNCTPENFDEADLKDLFDAASSSVYTTTIADSDGTATFSNMPVGSYLFVVTGSEATVYSMVIGSVYYAVDDDEESSTYGEWKIVNGAVDVEGDNLWVKAANPTVTKTEKDSNGDNVYGDSANVGDEVTFDITIRNIPSYEGDNPVFDVDDVLKNLTISTTELSSLTVKIMNGDTTVKELEYGIDYTVTTVGDPNADGTYNEFDVNFVVNGKYTLNTYANQGYTILIEYQATVVDNSEYDETYDDEEHENDVTLNYATTSYVANNTAESKDTDYEYDFKLEFTKNDNAENALAGATFGLYTDATCATAYTQDGKAVTAVSDEEGKVEFTGLAEGTYYLKEIEAPAGYLLKETIYTVSISAEYNTDGSIIESSISIVITNDAGETVNVISNTPVNPNGLPSTGGMGTTIFYIIGGVLVAGAVVVLITRRRMNHEA